MYVHTMYDELMKHVNDCNECTVDEFYRLYILLGLLEFLLSNKTGKVLS